MRRCLSALLVVGLVGLNTRDAAAQPSLQDVAAYSALNLTHVGAANPMMAPPAEKTGFSSVAARFAHHAPDAGDGNNLLAGTGYLKAGKNAIASATVGYNMVGCPAAASCDNGILLGADLESPLWKSAGNTGTNMSANMLVNFGWAKYGDLSALGASIGAPLAMVMEQSSKARFSVFVTPAFGWGSLDDGTTSESGTRPMVGFGLAWASPSGWAINGGFQKVMIENGGNNFGLGFSWNVQ